MTDRSNFYLGSAFFNAEQPPAVRRHLWFVLTDTAKFPDAVVVVNVSSTLATGDGAPCVVAAGEHSKVSKASYLRCEKARLTTVKDLETLLSKELVSLTTDLEGAIVDRLRQALLASKYTTKEVQKALRDQAVSAAK
jgi:hypothetical protein